MSKFLDGNDQESGLIIIAGVSERHFAGKVAGLDDVDAMGCHTELRCAGGESFAADELPKDCIDLYLDGARAADDDDSTRSFDFDFSIFDYRLYICSLCLYSFPFRRGGEGRSGESRREGKQQDSSREPELTLVQASAKPIGYIAE